MRLTLWLARAGAYAFGKAGRYLPVVLLALLTAIPVHAQDKIPVRAPGIHDEVLPLRDGPKIHFAVSVPAGYHGAPVPLILALHFGGNPQGAGRSMLEILIQPALGELGALIIAPDSVGGGWSTAANEQSVNALLAAVEKSYTIDPKKVIVTGFSMGGQGTWYWADKYPDRFSAAIPISGTPTPSAATWRLPVFAVHSRDDRVQPIGPTERRIAELKMRGINAQIVVLNGIEHFETNRFVGGLRQAVPWIREMWK